MARLALAMCCLFLLVAGAQAGTITFVPPNSPAIGPWNTVSQTIGGIEIHAFQFTGSTWIDGSPLTLFGRNQSNDHGVGVCSRFDGTGCGTSGTGGGDYNELDNAGGAEIIRLTLPDGYSWDSVQVSSLDQNSDPSHPANWERGQLFGSSFADPNVAAGNNTLLCNFVTGGSANNFCTVGTGFEPVLGLIGHKNDKYLYFLAQDWQGNNTNNDYLVYAATVSQTPEPGSILLLGAGLSGLGLLRRKFRG